VVLAQPSVVSVAVADALSAQLLPMPAHGNGMAGECKLHPGVGVVAVQQQPGGLAQVAVAPQVRGRW
jgi:hypothetical protein